MNKVILMGRLTRDPEVRYTGGESSAVARYTLAVDRRFKKEGGDTADFIQCVAFGKSGEFAEKYFKKGTKVVVEGRIQTGSYEKDGQRIYTTDVVVEQQEFAESKASSSEAAGNVEHQAAPSSAVGDGFQNIPDAVEAELPFA
ncbi:MAG: single-stranded DNA-binding protein [Lachnospiraceae bacterium]|nr:single-stranded DNA-binding protein [Lachnospiraceae bacterium]MCR5344794.1 single-stranded DNA-binding protein [Lachnospiraceae bacterium]